MSYSNSSTVPIDMLPGIGRRTAKVLHAFQIHTIGQFKSVPERVLIELFGPSIRAPYYSVHSVVPTGYRVRTNFLDKLKFALVS